ncbi:conserved hypothetical protein [Beutenbergia cavernae DSM 12333]|uniref:DUF2079 domain-containing protein n=1 Tax=Beutenbergia cavernae (strain ATCC BAA-8 / DSM 12333 / CCUG 43141 / JCM 11478 / NBRC 16432 / NCIMB 13614 / HKI 0122) TaxID=471853 RepID=C5BZ41_BEUC1|nr:DUF2079 domain-containing protein [Beutenbergia cavernae]ACQ81156.1 conserved hypothetical protein [Beutenbergia cavernae DSM 12333]
MTSGGRGATTTADDAAGEPDATDAVVAQAPAHTGRATWVAPSAVGLGVTAVYWLYAARQWANYDVPSWDLGIFTQTVQAYAELRVPIVPIKGDGFMILGDHFHPLLVVLAPFYAVFPSGLTLLLAQAVLFGLTAGIITRLAVRRLGTWPGVGIGIAAGLCWALASAAYSQFHEIALALPLLALSLAALTEGRLRLAVAWAVPIVLVKEDLGLTLAAIGFVVALRASTRSERRLGWATLAGGLAAFFVTTLLVLPALNPSGVWPYAQDSIAAAFLADPGAALASLGTGAPEKLLMVLAPFAVTGFVALRSPIALVAVPTLAWRLTSDVPYHWGVRWHYSAILVPIVFCALVDALPAIREQVRPAWREHVVPVVSGVVAVVALALLPFFPLWTLTDAATYAPSERAAAARRIEAQIPDGALVETDITLMAYLAPRTTVYWVGNENPTPDLLPIDTRSGVLHPPPTDIVVYAQGQHPGIAWIEIADDGGFLLARRAE